MRKHFIVLMIGILICAVSASAETLAELKAKMDKVAEDFHGTLVIQPPLPRQDG